MDVLKMLNDYFGTEAESIEEFEYNFKDWYNSPDYLMTMFNFLRYLDRQRNIA